MLRSPALIVPSTSGFVPFSGGGTIAGELDAEPRSGVLAPVASPWRVERETGGRPAIWEPGTSMSVRRVEMAVLTAVCGYFTFGLGKLLGLF